MQRANVLQSLAVDAMATDGEDWLPGDFALFADLLRIEHRQIVRHERRLKTERSAYFSEIGHNGDLFLDPDTGIATGKVSNRSQYVFPHELHDLLSKEPARVVAVYQHIRAQKTRDRLNQVVGELTRMAAVPLAYSSYESSTVAMLFLSRSVERVDAIHEHFLGYLGAHSHRLCRWPKHLRA
jgi:hypothetical protein